MAPKLFDTHAHVNFKAFQDDSADVLQSCLKERIWVNNIGSQYETSKRAVELAEKYPEGVYATVGLHPIHLSEQEVDEEEVRFKTREEEFDPDVYRKLAQNPKVVAIGECGLEYYRLPEGLEDEAKKNQEKAFRLQIELAIDAKKALMVHSRDAYEAIFEILKEYQSRLPAVIIHSFIGSWEQARKFLDIGCYISYNGIITYKPRKEKKPGQSDPELLQAVKNTPLDRILLETDSPYLSPEPLRGQRNVPQNVKYVAQKLAEIKKVDMEEIERQTAKNAKAVFSI